MNTFERATRALDASMLAVSMSELTLADISERALRETSEKALRELLAGWPRQAFLLLHGVVLFLWFVAPSTTPRLATSASTSASAASEEPAPATLRSTPSPARSIRPGRPPVVVEVRAREPREERTGRLGATWGSESIGVDHAVDTERDSRRGAGPGEPPTRRL